jgi:hypothetical protein
MYRIGLRFLAILLLFSVNSVAALRLFAEFCKGSGPMTGQRQLLLFTKVHAERQLHEPRKGAKHWL